MVKYMRVRPGDTSVCGERYLTYSASRHNSPAVQFAIFAYLIGARMQLADCRLQDSGPERRTQILYFLMTSRC